MSGGGTARVTISIPKEIYEKFLTRLYEKNKKTHGGVISKTITDLIVEYLAKNG